MPNRISFHRPAIDQLIDLRKGSCRIAAFQAQQSAFFQQFYPRQIDAGVGVGSFGALVRFSRARHVSTFAIQIAIGFESLAQLADHAEKLATLEGEIEMLLGLLQFTSV
jgi:hypothetical protein